MLVDFRVKNFALIDELEINFAEGLNVLTGETGAGKSIIIGALDILLGARASTDLIRKGKESAYIEAAFEPKRIDLINEYLEQAGIEADPDLLILSREIRQNGNNRNRINGQLVTASMIKDVSKYLVDIHGQHEHQRLLDSSSQLALLDEFIGQDKEELLQRIKELYLEQNRIDEELAALDIDEGEKAREIDLLKYQIQEIEDAALKDNELEELEQELKILINLEDINDIVARMYTGLQGDDYSNIEGIMSQIVSFLKDLEDLKDLDGELANFYNILNDIYYQMEELSFSLNNYHEKLEFDPEKLERVEKRLSLITSLQRKYGQTIEEIKNYQQEMEKRLEFLLAQDKLLAELTERKERILEEYYHYARKLSELRKNKALALEDVIANELADLAMNNTIFKIVFTEKAPSIDGIDKVEFLIAPNPGEDLKPLARIASGGELSRIMLALKTIIAHVDQVDTLIFDEVDTGVGGKVAQKMAEKLARIGKQRQVLCITHLPQIASMADRHFFIEKKQEENRTYTRIYYLDNDERKAEIARMLGGVELTDTTIRHAEEMLVMAEARKREF